jgi:ribosomal protein S18 acetylase RimI-like enzyme
MLDDHEKLIPSWKEIYFVTEMDSISHFQLFLEKNPDLSVLIEEDGEILGTALGSYDGRRGYIQKVVTSKKYRNHGIGKQAVLEVINRLKSVGALYIPISVEHELISFYEKMWIY